ncbi:MAG: TolC family protein [Syntrophobacteraceae bacterium]
MPFKERTCARFVPVFFSLFLIFLGCGARPAADTGWPEPSPLGRDLSAYRAPLDEEKAPADPLPEGDATGVITLRQALALALMKNPELASFSWEVRAKEARTLQAGLIPNPQVGVEVENFGGRNERSDFDSAETTVALSQLIELGGKRSKRERVAALEKDLSGWDYEAKRLDVLTDVARRFTDVLGAQKQLAYADELVGLAETSYRTVSERVDAGKVSPLESTKAGVSLSNTKIDAEQAKSNLVAARKKLAAMWGDLVPTFERVRGDLEVLAPVPSAEDVEKLLANNPDIRRWVKETEQRAATLEVEKAKRIPDLTVSGGVRHFSDTDDSAFVLGVSIPIPIFDRNQGGVKEAKQRLVKARQEARTAEAKAGSSLAESHQSLAFSYEQAMAIKNQVLPAAEHSFVAAGEGYREGKFDFLELLDSQRTLFEAREKYLESLINYHKAKADVERLIGDSLESINRANVK